MMTKLRLAMQDAGDAAMRGTDKTGDAGRVRMIFPRPQGHSGEDGDRLSYCGGSQNEG